MRVFIGVTGASGSGLAVIAVEELRRLGVDVCCCFTKNGRRVFEYETGSDGLDCYEYSNDDLFADVASGSSAPGAALIMPCSMSTLGEIANGCGKGLITRVADVCLKERKPLLLAARETPLNLIHLGNMVRAARAGAVIMPPCLQYYEKPRTLREADEAFVGRVLVTLGIENSLCRKWRD